MPALTIIVEIGVSEPNASKDCGCTKLSPEAVGASFCTWVGDKFYFIQSFISGQENSYLSGGYGMNFSILSKQFQGTLINFCLNYYFESSHFLKSFLILRGYIEGLCKSLDEREADAITIALDKPNWCSQCT